MTKYADIVAASDKALDTDKKVDVDADHLSDGQQKMLVASEGGVKAKKK